MRISAGIIFSIALLITGCASYRLGSGERSLPGGYDLVAVPMFKNKTMETGIEVYFTNALIEEFERSRVAHITPKNEAQVILRGSIDSVAYSPTGSVAGDVYLFQDLSLSSSYRILVNATLELVRSSDDKVIWKGAFHNERSYQAPQVTIEKINSVDPLYNQSARDIYISKMAKDMMSEAHNRITENF